MLFQRLCHGGCVLLGGNSSVPDFEERIFTGLGIGIDKILSILMLLLILLIDQTISLSISLVNICEQKLTSQVSYIRNIKLSLWVDKYETGQ